jgi:hypothetical protein
MKEWLESQDSRPEEDSRSIYVRRYILTDPNVRDLMDKKWKVVKRNFSDVPPRRKRGSKAQDQRPLEERFEEWKVWIWGQYIRIKMKKIEPKADTTPAASTPSKSRRKPRTVPEVQKPVVSTPTTPTVTTPATSTSTRRTQLKRKRQTPPEEENSTSKRRRSNKPVLKFISEMVQTGGITVEDLEDIINQAKETRPDVDMRYTESEESEEEVEEEVEEVEEEDEEVEDEDEDEEAEDEDEDVEEDEEDEGDEGDEGEEHDDDGTPSISSTETQTLLTVHYRRGRRPRPRQ